MEYSTSIGDLMKFAKALLDRLDIARPPVFLCVGSDKFVCDSVAPIVAEILKKEYDVPAYVYGGLDYNINATNLMEAVNYIETVHPDSHIVLIDATLDENVGKVRLCDGCFAGMGRCLPIKKVGMTSILAVVGRKIANFDLNSVRLKNVINLSRFIAQGCFMAVSKLQLSNLDKKRQKTAGCRY